MISTRLFRAASSSGRGSLLLMASRATAPLLTGSSFQGSSMRCKSSSSAVTSQDLDHDIVATQQQVHDANNSPDCRGKIEIRATPDYGWGLYTLRNFQKGEFVMKGRPLEICATRNSHSVQTDWNTHVIMDLPAILINHACGCAANVGIQDNKEGAYDFMALRDIGKGEELYWDYEAAEYEIQSQFQCGCPSPECRGQLRGFRHHGDLVRKHTGGDEYIANYLKNDKQ